MNITLTDQILLKGIISNRALVCEQSIHEFSNTLEISSSAVSKGCKNLGFEGYKDLQHRIRFAHEYKKKNIIDITEEINNLTLCRFNIFQNKADNIKSINEIETMIISNCNALNDMPNSRLNDSLFNCLTNILFYITNFKVEYNEVKMQELIAFIKSELTENFLYVISEN